MFCCLGFFVAGWDFELLVVCRRWLEAKPCRGGGGFILSSRHLQKLVAASRMLAGPLSLGGKQPCPAPGSLGSGSLSWDSTEP